MRVRFAPSPTGFLHIGGARTALFNYLFARKHGGSFILRIDDTDTERSESHYEKDIIDQLRWLGLEWDEGPEAGGEFGPYYQSQRKDRYKAVVADLVSRGAAYLDTDGTTRLKFPPGSTIVDDLVIGRAVFGNHTLGPEPVIYRANDMPTYHLASVVDDLDMQITHVIRGADHFTNTAKHLILLEAIGGKAPQFAHVPLILGADGTKLSKRNADGFVSVREFKEKGFLPEALVNFLLLLGWSHPESKEQINMSEAIEAFGLERISQAGALFDLQKLRWLNGWWLRHIDSETIAERGLDYLSSSRPLIEERGTRYWKHAIKDLQEGMATLLDSEEIAKQLVADSFTVGDDELNHIFEDVPEGERAGLKKTAGELLSAWVTLIRDLELEDGADCFSPSQLQQIFSMMKKKTTAKPKIMFQVIRLAVTGKCSGFELKVLLPHIRREQLVSRARALIETGVFS